MVVVPMSASRLPSRLGGCEKTQQLTQVMKSMVSNWWRRQRSTSLKLAIVLSQEEIFFWVTKLFETMTCCGGMLEILSARNGAGVSRLAGQRISLCTCLSFGSSSHLDNAHIHAFENIGFSSLSQPTL